MYIVIYPEYLIAFEAPVVFGISNSGSIFLIPNENIEKQETTAGEKNGFTNYAGGKWTATGPATVTIYKADGSKLKEETATIA